MKDDNVLFMWKYYPKQMIKFCVALLIVTLCICLARECDSEPKEKKSPYITLKVNYHNRIVDTITVHYNDFADDIGIYNSSGEHGLHVGKNKVATGVKSYSIILDKK